MFTATPGQLPEAGTPVVAGVRLPPGVQIRAAESGEDAPIAWVTTEVVPAEQLQVLVRTLAAAFEQTGLWPVQIAGLEPPSLDQPWLEEELEGPDDREIPALSVFDRSWLYPDGLDNTEDRFQEMAAAVPGPDLTAADLEAPEANGLMLVPTDRPANVPKVIGWLGATNYDMVGEPLASVLRSWEDRFGAVLVGLGFATVIVQVARLPQSDDEFDKLMTEHYSFCTDNIDQGMEWDDYRAGLEEWTFWGFWWD